MHPRLTSLSIAPSAKMDQTQTVEHSSWRKLSSIFFSLILTHKCKVYLRSSTCKVNIRSFQMVIISDGESLFVRPGNMLISNMSNFSGMTLLRRPSEKSDFCSKPIIRPFRTLLASCLLERKASTMVNCSYVFFDEWGLTHGTGIAQDGVVKLLTVNVGGFFD